MVPVNPDATWLLEVLDRGGRVQQREWLGPGTLSVGRAPDNDLIIDDPFIDPHHATLTVDDEAPRLQDLGSLNGTWLDARQPVTDVRLAHRQEAQLGHSILRLRDLAKTVPPARRDATSHGWVSWFRRPVVLMAMLALAVVALVFDAWIEETRRLSVGILANDIAYPLLGLLLWAGLWSAINRIASHRANFAVHLAIGATALAVLFIGDQLALLAAFALDVHAAAPVILLALEIGVTAVALFVHLHFVAHGRRSLQGLGAVVLAAVLFGSPALGDWLRRDDFSTQPYLRPLLLPPAARVVEGRSVEAFLNDAERLRVRVEGPRGD
ncbi:MAG: FHA domain-containing protein [Pseudomonadota bacterium]